MSKRLDSLKRAIQYASSKDGVFPSGPSLFTEGAIAALHNLLYKQADVPSLYPLDLLATYCKDDVDKKIMTTFESLNQNKKMKEAELTDKSRVKDTVALLKKLSNV